MTTDQEIGEIIADMSERVLDLKPGYRTASHLMTSSDVAAGWITACKEAGLADDVISGLTRRAAIVAANACVARIKKNGDKD